ncbi:MAG TPA: hypothetical protein VJO35_12530 [Terriglobales bacterium]|nr:hypothetical protein [Terriglobales bacterium]
MSDPHNSTQSIVRADGLNVRRLVDHATMELNKGKLMTSRYLCVFVTAVLLVCSATSLKAADKKGELRPFSTVGIGIKMSMLGPGFEVATPLSQRTNLRGGFNLFSYSRTFNTDGVSYNGKLQLRSGEVLLDWFPLGGSFHLSPGALVYNGNQVTATASVPGGSTFTVNHLDYTSDPANPVAGNGRVGFVRAAPMILAGWGNLVPRTKHFSVPFELGVVFQGSARTALNFATGNICDAGGGKCRPASSDAAFQSNVQAQAAKITNDLKPFKYYPVISIGVAYKF